jgi:hypothetical protein
MTEDLPATVAWTLGFLFGGLALWVAWRLAITKFWRMVDERIEHRVRMLAVAPNAFSSKLREIPYTVGGKGGQGSATEWDPVAKAPHRQSVPAHDGTSGHPDVVGAGPIFSAAAPAPVRPSRQRLADAWGEGSSEPLPKVLSPVGNVEAPEGLPAKKWVQPSKSGATKAKPIKPPKGQKRPARAGKNGKAKGKTQAKKDPTPRPSSLVLATRSKKANEINGAEKALDLVMA